jgi:molybdopterin molybdotransferase
MLQGCDYREARDAMLEQVGPVGTETAALSASAGRVLAQEVIAQADIPPFDRSPYDGYAFRAQDVENASEQTPVTLRIVDYIAAGDVPHTCIRAGEAAHLMTGAPVPEGADAVLPFERTRFTEEEVTIDAPVKSGSNVIYAGEDVRKGTVLCSPGIRIDAGLAGTLAGQGIFQPLVYKKPLVGVISTGSEILEENEPPAPGHIYNSNRYSLQAACELAGCRSVYIGTAGDDRDVIAGLIGKAVQTCHAVILSGGVSVGDFDCTPEAMVQSGVRLLAHGLSLKPGMAGAYGIYDADHESGHCRGEEKGSGAIPVFGLSGNPAACMTAFYAVVLPVLRRQMGYAAGACLPPQIRVRLAKDYSRKNQSTRLLRGKVDLKAAVQEMEITGGQGNQVLSSVAGSNAFAEIPAGETVQAQEPVNAFLMGDF